MIRGDVLKHIITDIMNIHECRKGVKVNYSPFPNCDNVIKENGIIKEVVDSTRVRVVYNCNGEWDNLDNYTSVLTDSSNLESGWVFGARNAAFCSKEDIQNSN